MLNFCNNFGLHQVNEFGTRKNSLIDLLLTNDPLIVSDIKCNPPFGSSDHDSLIADIDVYIKDVLTDGDNSNKM